MTIKGLYQILVIEDNQGDFVLIEEFLLEKFESPVITHATSFKGAKEIILLDNQRFDSILLDLSLPDKKGEQLILGLLEICFNTPVIVLTGYADFAFGVKSLSLGVSDYILKEELTALSLYKSIIYSAERKKGVIELEESERKYYDLFHLSPLPMWVVNLDSLQFLDVNMATVNNYGYSREEFLLMTLKDIRPAEFIPLLEKNIQEGRRESGAITTFNTIHKIKNGELRNVEVKIAPFSFKGTKVNVVIANDITERLNYIKAIEEQNNKLKEISWLQSHVIRAPLARIMGLINIIRDIEEDEVEKEKILDYIVLSANELDDVIRNINVKTEGVKH